MKIKNYLFVSVLSLVIAAPVLALERTASSSPGSTVRKDVLHERREAAEKRMETRREQIQDKIEAKREAVKDRLEQHREDLKKRLQEFKDKRKAQIAERIQNNLTALNERMVNNFGRVLDKLDAVLERIVSRADKAEAAGKDTSSVESAIIAAQTAIAAARAAVANQAGKTYLVEVADEERIRSDVGSARQALHADLKVVFEAVKAAKEAVRKAATTLAKIPRVDEDPSDTATSTASE